MAFLDDFDHSGLTALAKSDNPRVKRWVGVRSTSSRRTYTCHLCGEMIDTESSRNRPTKHAAKAIEDHRAEHIGELIGRAVEESPFPEPATSDDWRVFADWLDEVGDTTRAAVVREFMVGQSGECEGCYATPCECLPDDCPCDPN